jgi:hypothetical protein
VRDGAAGQYERSEPHERGLHVPAGVSEGVHYIVEPTGSIEDDPNLTDKKSPDNPTKSFRSRKPLRVTGERTVWQEHSPEVLKAMKDYLEEMKRLGVEAIND